MYSLMIVDDETHIIDGLKSMIDWQQLEITSIYTATEFHEALETALVNSPNICMVDVKIDSQWGYDLIQKITEAGVESNYIMMSGYDEFEYVRQSLLAGAREYLLKPLNCAEIERIVKRIIVENLGGSVKAQVLNDAEIDPVLDVPYNSFSKLTNRILGMVRNEYDKNISLINISKEFKMNNRYLGQVFLSETNVKFSEYLMAYRMRMARTFIENSTAKISYIAKRVGYTNLNYFYSHFKLYYNLSPSDLREK